MLRKLKPESRYTECHYCCIMGCQWTIDKYGVTFGHWIWTLDMYVKRPVLNALNLKRQFRCLKRWLTALDYSKIEDVEVDGINTRDYPDFCDAFIASATYKGREMTQDELDRLNEDSDYVYECVQERLY